MHKRMLGMQRGAGEAVGRRGAAVVLYGSGGTGGPLSLARNPFGGLVAVWWRGVRLCGAHRCACVEEE